MEHGGPAAKEEDGAGSSGCRATGSSASSGCQGCGQRHDSNAMPLSHGSIRSGSNDPSPPSCSTPSAGGSSSDLGAASPGRCWARRSATHWGYHAEGICTRGDRAATRADQRFHPARPAPALSRMNRARPRSSRQGLAPLPRGCRACAAVFPARPAALVLPSPVRHRAGDRPRLRPDHLGRRPSGVASTGNGAAMRAAVVGVYLSRSARAASCGFEQRSPRRSTPGGSGRAGRALRGATGASVLASHRARPPLKPPGSIAITRRSPIVQEPSLRQPSSGCELAARGLDTAPRR